MGKAQYFVSNLIYTNSYDYSLSPFISKFVRGLGLLMPSKRPSEFTERWREKRQFYRSNPYFCGIIGDCMIANHTSSIDHVAKSSSTVSNLDISKFCMIGANEWRLRK